MHFLKCINFAEQVYIDEKKKRIEISLKENK